MTVEASEQLPDQSKQQSEAAEPLNAKETREIVTPYAFGVADELLGQPLASPMRRLLAQCIDVSLVVLLSTAHALVLAFFVAITFSGPVNTWQKARKNGVLRARCYA